MQNNHIKNVAGILTATFFISTSGVLGKYIAMPSEVIVWFRSAFAVVLLYAFCRFKKINLSIESSKHYAPFLISAFFMAAHWITYFYALKKSNVAIGMLSLYTFPVMIALLEPLVFKIKFNPIHIVLGLLVLLGIYILAPDLNLESSNMQGILFGLLSALCYSIRILILKQYVIRYNGVMLMFYQTLIITIFLVPVLFFMDVSGFESQYPYLLMLALLTTAIGHSLMVHSLQFFSVSTASIISSVQPIFGIILAFIFLNEIPTLNTFFGGALILATVVIESLRSKSK
ncbi:DMT family transporter [Tenacibaculum sp. IB213877]|uniref:DMT family transporter n=1 Tax=Tenacibaculum sp. IB213877 TaxID=3097351 RepID=UPI002A5AAC53|nr:DMT family transporter [Tenacibaculum sp. IB213877]MDY0780493.1 DMT family transporter [Tenacibaculum sp. IB213877]